MMRKQIKNERRKKVKVDARNYEVVNYGPLRMERIGRVLTLSSHWEPGEFQEYVQRVKAHRSELREDINKKISELAQILEQYDPLELLSAIAIKNVFANPETYKESSHEGKESYVEYAQSLALGIKNPHIGVHATKEALEKLESFIAEVFMDIMWFFSSEGVNEGDKDKQWLHFHALMQYLFLRGDSFPEHHIDLIKELFEPQDRFFQENYGFTTEQALAWVEAIEAQVQENFKQHWEFFGKLHETDRMFIEFSDEKSIEGYSSFEEYMDEFNSQPEVQAKSKELGEMHENLESILFIVKPDADLPEDFLRIISASFGDNEAFATFKKSPNWPTNNTVVYRRPLIAHHGNYYCFGVQILFRNLFYILEELIREKDSAYFQNVYQKKRGEYLVRKALGYFTALLPGAQVFEGLYYPITENGENKRPETDGLVIYDCNLFIIEGKAGGLSLSAKRGGLKSLETDVKELIDKAHVQALRTKKFILDDAKPRFEFENGAEALVIENKSDLKNIYLVNITLENLWQLSTQLNSLKTFNLIKGKEWPWSVGLNNLRVISEIVESPSEFLLYLQRRIRANDYPQFRAADELDFLMFYLNEGLYFEDEVLNGLDAYTPHGYTEALDRYYDLLGGRVSSGEKPRSKRPEEYKELVRKIEATEKKDLQK